MDLFKTLNNIYTKKRFNLDNIQRQDVLGIFRWLAMDIKNLPILRRINPYLFYLSPENLLILLYFSIQQRNKAPFIKYTKKVKKPEISQLYNKIRHYFGWSTRELALNEKYLQKLDVKHWKKAFGIK